METFARNYLRLDGDQIQTISDSRRDNREGFKFDILEHWRNQNPGPNARAVGIITILSYFQYFRDELECSEKMKIYVFTY